MVLADFTPGEPNTIAIVFFVLFVVLALGITWWAAADADDRSVLRRRPQRHGLPERPRALR